MGKIENFNAVDQPIDQISPDVTHNNNDAKQ